MYTRSLLIPEPQSAALPYRSDCESTLPGNRDRDLMERLICETHSSRMEHPPPVPVTHPRVQNFAQSEGMRLAGWSGLLDVMSWSGSCSELMMAR